MSEPKGAHGLPELSLGTWNMAAEKQGQRVGQIAEYLASQGSGITILTELVEVDALKKALTREMGQDYELDAVATGSAYGDSVGILTASKGCHIEDDVEAVPTGGKKMPYIMRTVVSTPLGGMTVAAMRGAYFIGKRGHLTSGAQERQAQYRKAVEVLENAEGISLIGGDMNSFARNRDPLFAAAGYERLTGDGPTWPALQGIRKTTKDAQVIALPFLLIRKGFAVDAIYGKGPIESGESEAYATGLSDHMYVGTTIRPANP